MNYLKVCVITIAGVIFAAACAQGSATQNVSNPSPETSKSIAKAPAQPAAPVDEMATAKELWAANCAVCHRDSGKGGKVTVEGKTIDPDDVTTAKMKAKSDDKLFGYIHEGFPDDGMPAFKDKLTDDQIRWVVKHLRTL